MTLVSEQSGSNVKLSNMTIEEISSLLVKEKDGRLSPRSQDSNQCDNLTHFSSSLHSVFTTNHPQKATLVLSMMRLLRCESTNELVLCDREKNLLKHYAQEQEENIAQFLAPCFQDEFSCQDTWTCADEETVATFESLSA